MCIKKYINSETNNNFKSHLLFKQFSDLGNLYGNLSAFSHMPIFHSLDPVVESVSRNYEFFSCLPC